MAGPGASSCTRACSSTMAMASLPPKTWCTTMPCGVTTTTRAAKTRRRAAYSNGICTVKRIEVVNDYEIVMHCKVVCLDLAFYYSSASNVIIFSKAQWDKEGEMGYETQAGRHRAVYLQGAATRPLCAVRACPHAALEARRGGLERTADDLDDSKSRRALRSSWPAKRISPRSTRTSSMTLVAKGYKLIRSRRYGAADPALSSAASTSARRTSKRGAIRRMAAPRANSTRRCRGPTKRCGRP